MEVEKSLSTFIKEVVRQSKSNLTRQDRNVSKKLYNSIKGEYKVHKNSIGIYFTMEEHGEYLDKGVKGANPSLVKNGKQKAPNSPYKFTSKRPPMQSLSDWAKKKNIRFRNAKGQYDKGNYRSIGFWLQKRVYAQGIKPSLFFTKAFEGRFKKLPDSLIEKFGLDIDEQFNNIIK